jgi:hypothetical protein
MTSLDTIINIMMSILFTIAVLIGFMVLLVGIRIKNHSILSYLLDRSKVGVYRILLLVLSIIVWLAATTWPFPPIQQIFIRELFISLAIVFLFSAIGIVYYQRKTIMRWITALLKLIIPDNTPPGILELGLLEDVWEYEAPLLVKSYDPQNIKSIDELSHMLPSLSDAMLALDQNDLTEDQVLEIQVLHSLKKWLSKNDENSWCELEEVILYSNEKLSLWLSPLLQEQIGLLISDDPRNTKRRERLAFLLASIYEPVEEILEVFDQIKSPTTQNEEVVVEKLHRTLHEQVSSLGLREVSSIIYRTEKETKQAISRTFEVYQFPPDPIDLRTQYTKMLHVIDHVGPKWMREKAKKMRGELVTE